MQQPQIVEKPEWTVVGCQGAFIHALSPDANNLQVIGALWKTLLKDCGDINIPNRIGGSMFGVIFAEPEEQRSHRHELQYIAGVSVSATDDVPEGMVVYTIPAATYAVFTHVGPMERIGETVSDAYRNWLPSSSFQPAEAADVEQYDDRFRPGSDESVMEYWIAVAPQEPVD